MRQCKFCAAAIMLAALLLVTAAPMATASTKPSLTLKASATYVHVDRALKLTVTVVSSNPPYEVRILRKTTDGWVRIKTATLVSDGKYAAYVSFGTTGKRRLKAAFVNASGTVVAYSNIVTIHVT